MRIVFYEDRYDENNYIETKEPFDDLDLETFGIERRKSVVTKNGHIFKRNIYSERSRYDIKNGQIVYSPTGKNIHDEPHDRLIFKDEVDYEYAKGFIKDRGFYDLEFVGDSYNNDLNFEVRYKVDEYNYYLDSDIRNFVNYCIYKGYCVSVYKEENELNVFKFYV